MRIWHRAAAKLLLIALHMRMRVRIAQPASNSRDALFSRLKVSLALGNAILQTLFFFLPL